MDEQQAEKDALRARGIGITRARVYLDVDSEHEPIVCVSVSDFYAGEEVLISAASLKEDGSDDEQLEVVDDFGTEEGKIAESALKLATKFAAYALPENGKVHVAIFYLGVSRSAVISKESEATWLDWQD